MKGEGYRGGEALVAVKDAQGPVVLGVRVDKAAGHGVTREGPLLGAHLLRHNTQHRRGGQGESIIVGYSIVGVGAGAGAWG